MAERQLDVIEREVATLARDQQYELLQRLVRRLSDTDAELRRARLDESVRRLREWASEPNDDDEVWDALERHLREYPVSFRVAPVEGDEA